jgi:arylsulfatase A-like enzyme
MSKDGSGLQKIKFDVKSAALATLFGVFAVACVDYLATLIVGPGPLRFATILRLLLLELTLACVLFLQALPLMLGGDLLTRLAMRVWRPTGAWAGLFGPARDHAAPSRAAGWLWGLAIAGAGFLAVSTLTTLKLSAMFKEPQLTAFVLAVSQLVVAVVFFALAAGIAAGLHFLSHKLHPRLGVLNPLGSTPAAGVGLAILAWPMFNLLIRLLPQLAPYLEMRHVLSLGSFVVGAYASTQFQARRGSLFPTDRKRRIQAMAASALGLALLVPSTLFYFGADQDTKALAISSSPTMSRTMTFVRRATDFDGDGFGSLLGENDCSPFNAKIHPMARDIPDNQIDEDCNGRDFKLGVLPSYKTGEKMPVPEAFQEDWNFLLLTVDTVRYDHTTFGGYVRDTTPELAKFVKRSANFTFANAPSAGTMASIPAILTSKFFHSGIALEEDVPRGSPPRLKEENTLLHELFKEKGYKTGAILSHEYFNDWGMDQGVDDYDNTVGKKRAPRAVTSEILTSRSIAWIGRQRQKWFLWTHYIDPHGYYVSHPGEVSYGDTEMDLYDGELHFTDKHIANLLDYIARSPGGNKTVIAITSDHGDAFGEHGYINHAQDLHREILHVPLIFYVPNIEPRSIPGAVSPIDIFPTFADLLGVDISHLNVEGESLVPQLFYGKDAEHRVVFAETNYPKPLRAVVNSRYKLILDIKNNVSRLWDLKKDPMELKNVWTKDKAGYKEMRGYLNEWLERVVYSRDAESNQAIAKLKDHLVGKRPAAAKEVKSVALEGGKVAVDSLELSVANPAPSGVVEVSVYFRAKTKTEIDYKFQVEAWLEEGPNKSRLAKSRLRTTGGGMFPSSRWHPGELIRDRFKITLPATWKSEPDGRKVVFGLRARASGKEKPVHTGPMKEGSSDLLILGETTLSNPTPTPAPTPAPTKTPSKTPVKSGDALPAKTIAPSSIRGARGMRKLQPELKEKKPAPPKAPASK